ncbi:MAG: PHP domain-containing protein [Bacteroidales bacterium]|nr:PHP domain-containing protein [Bacteroidales bacterium]
MMTKKHSGFWGLILGLVFSSCSPDPLPDNIDLQLHFGSTPPATGIVNPYKEVDLTQTKRLKANLHTHTTFSDGNRTPDEMIRAYAEKGYDVVAITDHDKLYVNSTDFVHAAGRDVLVIKGNEISLNHHFNSLFTNASESPELPFEPAITNQIEYSNNCVLFLNHPGRYSASHQLDFYIDLFGKFPSENLVGMEIINRKDEYPSDKNLWHAMLTNMSPARAVYGFANDDAHSYADIGFSFNEFLTQHFTEEGVREAIVNGASFFYTNATVSKPTGPMPYVKSIVVNTEAMTITVDAQHFDRIEWRSCGLVVSREMEIVINNEEKGYNLSKYVQFTLTGKGGQLFSQPFLIE